MIKAIRRDLSAGAVFFRQRGDVVEYSLDNSVWYSGFKLTSGVLDNSDTVITPQIAAQYQTESITTIINNYVTYQQSVTNNNGLITPAIGERQMRRNICVASALEVAAFVALLNETRERNQDTQWDIATAVAGIVAFGAGVLASFFVTPAGGVAVGGVVLGTAKGFIAIAASASAANVGGTLITKFDNVPDVLTDEEIKDAVCNLYTKMSVSNNNQTAFVNAFDDFAGFSPELIEAWREYASNTDVWLSYIQNVGVANYTDDQCICTECDSVPVILTTVDFNTGVKQFPATIRTRNRPYDVASNSKYLRVSYTLPTPREIDSVTIGYSASTVGLQGGLGSPIFYWDCTVQWPPSQFNRQRVIYAQSPYTQQLSGRRLMTWDFSAVTYTSAPTGIVLELPITVATTQAASIDPTTELILESLEICYR